MILDCERVFPIVKFMVGLFQIVKTIGSSRLWKSISDYEKVFEIVKE